MFWVTIVTCVLCMHANCHIACQLTMWCWGDNSCACQWFWVSTDILNLGANAILNVAAMPPFLGVGGAWACSGWQLSYACLL